MAVSNTNVSALYAANGVLTTFAINFAFVATDASAQIDVYLLDADGVATLQVEGALNDYTLQDPYDVNTNPSGPSQVVFNTAPANLLNVLIERVVPYTQVVSYVNNGAFNAKDHERALDRIVYQIQQVKAVADRALTLGEQSTVSGEIPPPVADTVLGVNSAGDELIWIPLANIAGAPPGGLTGSVLAKLSDADLDFDWVQYAFDGYSSRFGAQFTSTDLMDTLSKIIVITYTAPAISLSASGSNTIREKGTSVASTTLTATITKRSDPIAEVRFYRNPSTLLDTQVAGGGIPSGGNSTYNYATPFSDNVTFRAEADDNGATGGPSTASATASFTFVYPYYVGAGAVGLSAANVALLTKLTIVSTATVARLGASAIVAANGNVLFFAYPASYGALTSILDENNFETIGDWTLRTENITGLDASAQSYRIYEFNNPVIAGPYGYTFKR